MSEVLCRGVPAGTGLTDILNHKEEPYLYFEMVPGELAFRLKASFLPPRL